MGNICGGSQTSATGGAPLGGPMSSKGGNSFATVYKLGPKLGEGAFSVVKTGKHMQTGDTFAIKIVTKANLSKADEVALVDEIDILKDLRCEHIIGLYDVFSEKEFYYLVTEEMRGGELFDRVVSKSFYNEKEARDLCLILFKAIAFCHKRYVAHRDLKPENLLLASKTDDTTLKLADFGFAKRVDPSMPDSIKTQCGTPGYVAPEILKGVLYGVQADMWSLGVITYILLGGYPPFIEDNQKKLFHKIRKGEFEFHPQYWGNVSKEAKELISSMLTVDPSKRITAEGALNSSWMTSGASVLSSRDLGINLQEFKKFNAKRKFKGAVKATIALNKMSMFTGSGGGPAAATKVGHAVAKKRTSLVAQSDMAAELAKLALEEGDDSE